MNVESGPEVDQFFMIAKDSKAYWKKGNRITKRTYTNSAGKKVETSEYSARLQWAGKRMWVNLGSGNKDIAAQIAADKYKTLTREGWEGLEKKSPEQKREITVGEFLKEIKRVIKVSPRAWGNYSQGILQIVGELKGLSSPSGAKFTKTGRKEWLNTIERAPLSILSHQSLSIWTKDYVTKRNVNPEKGRQAKTSCNSILAKAHPLFNKDLLKLAGLSHLEDPFKEIKKYPAASTRYQSNFNAERLLRVAQEELTKPQGKAEKVEFFLRRTEAFKALILVCFTAIRRKEADLLLWDQINFVDGFIEIRRTKFFEPKAESAIGRVPLGLDAISILRDFRDRSPDDELVLQGPLPATGQTYSYVRCKKTFKFVYQWLRSYVDEYGQKPLANYQKPVHTIRKEVGAIITTRNGIFAAQRFLRHSEIGTTQKYYSDQKEEVTVGINLTRL